MLPPVQQINNLFQYRDKDESLGFQTLTVHGLLEGTLGFGHGGETDKCLVKQLLCL